MKQIVNFENIAGIFGVGGNEYLINVNQSTTRPDAGKYGVFIHRISGKRMFGMLLYIELTMETGQQPWVEVRSVKTGNGIGSVSDRLYLSPMNPDGIRSRTSFERHLIKTVTPFLSILNG